MGFKKCTSKYVNLKMSQYVEVAEHIAEVMDSTGMESCEDSFKIVKQMIINNEMLSWRMIPDAFKDILKLFSKWIPILATAVAGVIVQVSSDDVNILTGENFWAIFVTVYAIGIMIEIMIEVSTDKTEDMHLRMLKDMSYGQYQILCNYKKDSSMNEKLGVKKEFLKLYQYFKEDVKDKNNITLADLKMKKIEFVSKEMLFLLISECIVEDIDTFLFLKENNFCQRYTDAILRNMSEQVIEYLYIMEHKELIPVYLGVNLNEELDEKENLFVGLKKTGQARFGERTPVKKMAKTIGEDESTDDKIALYDIFSLKAEMEHNSYFNHIFELLEILEEREDEEKNDLEDMDYLYLICILTALGKEGLDKSFHNK